MWVLKLKGFEDEVKLGLPNSQPLSGFTTADRVFQLALYRYIQERFSWQSAIPRKGKILNPES